jgi:hypothetical protein
MWYAASKLFETAVVFLGRGVDPKTMEELAARQGGCMTGKGTKQQVEAKGDYKARGKPSPDRADACVMLIHNARLKMPQIKAKADDTPAMPAVMDLDTWAAKVTLRPANIVITGLNGFGITPKDAENVDMFKN